ncbi:MAG: N-acetylmuramoyl-L-alanine amidase [Lachnospiraceae bacterium]|nr:N-acetylmuramoyl-L-alanine amidase [Lachnospiraceae bacterium]
MKKWKEAFLYLAMGAMLIVTGFLAVRETAFFVTSRQAEIKKTCVVIDAGHGGDDPGKIGINGAAERDINLQVAQKVKMFLEMEGIETVMTRKDEKGLYDSGAENKKVQDMKRRIAMIEETAPEITVSIHQNSYPEEYVKGAQVFYYKDSPESKTAAEIMQKSLKRRLDPENHREAKANASYYLLKKTSTPVIIVECGFLSNREEAAKLAEEDYQEQVAWAVFMGIMQTLNAGK